MAGIYQRELPNAPVFTPSRGYNNVDFGVDSFMKAGALLGNALGGLREKELENAKIAREAEKYKWEQDRFAREQELNKRQDLEYNREIGLRDMRKNLAAEYEANPYADVWGGGAANKMLDKQVLDYVGSGKEITPEMAANLQAVYETNRPFKEDLSQVFRSRLLAAGEDPTKADAYAKSMTDSIPFSRAAQQAQLDKQQEIQQGYYNAVAAANKDVAKMGFDIAKANQEASIDKAKLDLDYKKLLYGNTGGSGSGGTTADGDKITAGGIGGISQILKSIGPSDAKEGNQDVEAWHNKGYSYQQIYSAMKDAVDTDPTALVLSDNTLNTKAVNERLAMLTPGANQFTNNSKVSDITSNVGAKDLLAQFAPRQIAGYNPEGMLERAKTVVPELFKGEVPAVINNVGNTQIATGKMPESLVKAEGVRNEPYKDTKGNVTVGVGYAFNKSDDEIKRDFKEAGIPEEKISGLKAMNGTKLTNEEVSRLADVSYDRYGVKKLDNIGIDITELNPKLAEIGVSQAYRGDIVKEGSGYRGKLYEYLKNDDLDGMVKYVNGSKEVPKEVKTRLGLVVDREGPISKDQAMYEGVIPRLATTFTEPVDAGGSVKSVDAFNTLTPSVVDKTKDRLTEDFDRNGSGPIDYARYVKNVMKDGNVSRQEATGIVNKYINSQQIPEDIRGRVGGIGNMTVAKSPKQLFSEIDTHDRLAELNRVLGDNPAPTPANIALIDERQSLLNSMVSPAQKVRGMNNDLINRYLNFTGIGSGIPTK